MNYEINKSEDEWKKELTPEQYKILRQKGTEMAFTGALYKITIKEPTFAPLVVPFYFLPKPSTNPGPVGLLSINPQKKAL